MEVTGLAGAVPASPQRSGCSAGGAAEQNGADGFAADRTEPAQVLARLADSVRPSMALPISDTAGAALAAPQTAFSCPVWPVCCWRGATRACRAFLLPECPPMTDRTSARSTAITIARTTAV